MNQNVLLFCLDSESFIGLWQPAHGEQWQKEAVVITRTSQENPLFLALETLLTKNQLTLHAISAIGVTQGPGSYTQLRSFIAAANSLAWAAQIPIFAFPAPTKLPDEIPQYLNSARLNVPIDPIYPTAIL